MPEGPDVRKHAEELDAALRGEPLTAFSARTKAARNWLAANPEALLGKRVLEVRSRGKNLIGRIEGGYYFYSHLMMWGRWQVLPPEEAPERDRRERARIVVPQATALLLSAPIFEVGQGDLFAQHPHLAALGPDSLPYPDDGPFDVDAFRERLFTPENRERTIGAALLDQTIVSGIGNYLRAEMLFRCGLNPWTRVGELMPSQLDCLYAAIPAVTTAIYETTAVTSPEDRARMQSDPALVYVPGREYGTRYYVFRRTNLPCLRCGDTVRQLRQVTHQDAEGGDKTRIIYFCPTCQQVPVKPGSKSRKRKTAETQSPAETSNPPGETG
jgi:endonuclease-8